MVHIRLDDGIIMELLIHFKGFVKTVLYLVVIHIDLDDGFAEGPQAVFLEVVTSSWSGHGY